MNTIDDATGGSPHAGLQEICDRAAKGIAFSREEQDAAMKRMERIREAIRKSHGVQDNAVDLIREGRDSR